MVTTQGKHTPFVFHDVGLISSNSLFSIVVQNIVTFFLLRSLAVHLLHPLNIYYQQCLANSVKRTNMVCQYVIYYNNV